MHTRFIIIWIANINFELDSDLKPVDLNLDWVDLTTYFAPGRGAKYCDERVYVCPLSYLQKQHVQTSQKFSVHVISGHGSVFLWRQCDTLCTSGFVDNVMFSHNGQGKGDANRACTQSNLPGAEPGRSMTSTIALLYLLPGSVGSLTFDAY